MKSTSKGYGWFALLILVPVIILSIMAGLGLSAQRKGALADAQQQARAFVNSSAAKLQEALARQAAYQVGTQGILLPVPPQELKPGALELKDAIAKMDKAALEKLVLSEHDVLSETGLPVNQLAALAALELGAPVDPVVYDEWRPRVFPSLLTGRWLERWEAVADVLPNTAASMDDPNYLTKNAARHAREYWDHDEAVRRAFWDEARSNWRVVSPGAHVVDGEVFWIARHLAVDQPIPEPFPAPAVPTPRSGPTLLPDKVSQPVLCVLTPDELADLVNSSISQYSVPPWMGLTVTMNGQSVRSVRKQPHAGVTLVTDPAGQSKVVSGRLEEREEWLDASPQGEVLAVADGHFTVMASLKHPPLLYTAVNRLTNWTAWLLACSIVSAGIGVWVVKRNLDRERRLNELKSQFVSSVSHELRAPVGSLRLMADALDQGTVTGEQAGEFHRLMSQEGARLSSLIENVLDFARMEQNRKTYLLEETDITTLVQETIRLMTHQAKAREVVLELELHPLSRVPKLDAPAMQQALINLLDNAIKFSPVGERIVVTLAENVEAKEWTLSVKDHGPGIPAAERERIFERFYRLGNELRRETQGTGIGLSLVKHIVEGNGGRISVTCDGGACFKMSFPIPT